jgi:hypothetical protein
MGGGAMTEIEQALWQQLKRLDNMQKARLLAFIEAMVEPAGESGPEFLRRTSTINFPKDDLAEIARSIEENEERIDWDEWNTPVEFNS